MSYPKSKDSVDVVLLTIRKGQLCVFLAERQRPDAPHHGRFALPGGYIHIAARAGGKEDESVEATARRVLLEKVGLRPGYLEQLYTFSGRGRDERGWSLSVCYYAMVREDDLVVPDGVSSRIVPVQEAVGLPFDHDAMVRMAVDRVRGKSTYSSLPLFLMPETFTLTELMEVYSAVRGEPIPKTSAQSFRRKIEDFGLIRELPGRLSSGHGRPAQLYTAAHPELRQFARNIG